MNPHEIQRQFDFEQIFPKAKNIDGSEMERGSSGDWNDMSEFKSAFTHTPNKQFGALNSHQNYKPNLQNGSFTMSAGPVGLKHMNQSFADQQRRPSTITEEQDCKAKPVE